MKGTTVLCLVWKAEGSFENQIILPISFIPVMIIAQVLTLTLRLQSSRETEKENNEALFLHRTKPSNTAGKGPKHHLRTPIVHYQKYALPS